MGKKQKNQINNIDDENVSNVELWQMAENEQNLNVIEDLVEKDCFKQKY